MREVLRSELIRLRNRAIYAGKPSRAYEYSKWLNFVNRRATNGDIHHLYCQYLIAQNHKAKSVTQLALF
jgi:hypothetical protein